MQVSKKQRKALEKSTGIKAETDCHSCDKKGILTSNENGLFYQCKNYCESFTTTEIDNINCLLTKETQI